MITIYEKYYNSNKVICNDIKNLLSSVCMPSLLPCFMKKKELPKLCKLKEYSQDDVIHAGSFQLWQLSSLEKITIVSKPCYRIAILQQL